MTLREFFLASGTRVLAGKNAESNEKIIEQAEPEELIFHTKEKGSPFVNIKKKPKLFSRDIKNTAIITASYSQDWRDNESDVVVHFFKKKDIYKLKNMKTGTFGIKNFKVIKIKKEDIKKFIKDKI